MLVALGTYRLVKVADDLRRARSLLETALGQIEEGKLGPARAEMAEAQNLLALSNGRLYSDPALEILDVFPVIHQNLEAMRRSVGLALTMTDGGNRLLEVTKPLESAAGKLEVPLDGGTIPLDAVRQAQAITDELAGALPGPAAPPSTSLVVGPIADAQDKLYAQAYRRRSQLDGVSRALRLLAGLSGENGSKRYLIAVANSAEMRGSGGMVLSYGILNADHGTFTLGEFGNIDELFLDDPVDPASLDLPADYLARWGTLEPTRLWRNSTVNADLEFDAPILEAMFTAKTQLALDGVIQIDPAGLGAILVGTGPVAVPGLGDVSADNVVDLTLNRAYVDFPDRDQRQELLGDVARVTFDRLVGGKLDSLRPLGNALYKAALAGHVDLFVNDAALQREARFFKAGGELPPPDTQDYAVLTVQNFSKNKLDYYVDSAVEITGDRPSRRPGTLTATVTITNNAPADGSSPYVFGPNAAGEEAGLYKGVVSLYLPNGVSLESSEGDPTTSAPVETADAGRSVVTFSVELPPGESRRVSLDLAMAPRPKGPYALTLVPIGRVRPTAYSVDVTADEGRAVRPLAPLTAPETVAARR